MTKEQTEQIKELELRALEDYKEMEGFFADVNRLTIDGKPTQESELAKDALDKLEDAYIAIQKLRSTFGDNYYLNLSAEEKKQIRKNKAKMKVKVARGVANQIANQFGCSKSKVCAALHFQSNSAISKEIREAALKYYNGRIIRAESFLK